MHPRYLHRARVAGLVAALLLPARSAAAIDPLWEPRPVPASCRAFDVHMLAQDVSRSMSRSLAAALAQQAKYVQEAPACTYVIYAEFGTTARIVTDGFLVTPEDRGRIASEVRSPPRTEASTNLDEAAALIELTILKMERAYAERPWSFTASVLSDHIPEPSEGHEPFDLRGYLAQRRQAAQVDVLAVEIVTRGVAPTAHEVRTARGRITAPVEALAEVLRTAVVPAKPPAPVAPAMPAVSPPAWRDVLPWTWLGAGAVVFLAALLAFIRARRSGPALPVLGDERALPLPDRAPCALRITEVVVDGTGAVTETLRDRIEFPVAVGVPVAFATDPTADLPLRAIPGVSERRVLDVTPELDGRLRIRGVGGLKCNGDVVPRAGAVVDATTAVRVEIADRRWLVAAVWEDAARASDLLAVSRRPGATNADNPRHLEVQ